MVNDRALQSSDRELRKNVGPALGKPLAPPGTLSHLCLCRGEEREGLAWRALGGPEWGHPDVPTSQATTSGWAQSCGLQPPSRTGDGGELKAGGAGLGSKSHLVRSLVSQNHTALCHYHRRGCYHPASTAASSASTRTACALPAAA